MNHHEPEKDGFGMTREDWDRRRRADDEICRKAALACIGRSSTPSAPPDQTIHQREMKAIGSATEKSMELQALRTFPSHPLPRITIE